MIAVLAISSLVGAAIAEMVDRFSSWEIPPSVLRELELALALDMDDTAWEDFFRHQVPGGEENRKWAVGGLNAFLLGANDLDDLLQRLHVVSPAILASIKIARSRGLYASDMEYYDWVRSPLQPGRAPTTQILPIFSTERFPYRYVEVAGEPVHEYEVFSWDNNRVLLETHAERPGHFRIVDRDKAKPYED